MNTLLILDHDAEIYETELRKKDLPNLLILTAPDLTAALQNGEISGAVLDVFEQEQLPEDSPLWTMDNVMITPHNSAYSFPEQVVEIFAANYRHYLNGSPLDHRVDFARGY